MASGRTVFGKWMGHRVMSKWMWQEPSLLFYEVTVRIPPPKRKQDSIRYQQITYLPALWFRRLVNQRTVFLMFNITQALVISYSSLHWDIMWLCTYFQLYICFVGIWLIFSVGHSLGRGWTDMAMKVGIIMNLHNHKLRTRQGHAAPHNAHLPKASSYEAVRDKGARPPFLSLARWKGLKAEENLPSTVNPTA